MASTINADNGVSSGSAGLKESADSSGVLQLQTNGTAALTIDTSQNVGIGTASPTGKLHVAGTAATGLTSFNSTGTTTAYNVTSITNTSGSAYYGVESSVGGTVFTGSTAYATLLGTGTATSLQFATNNSVRATIDSSGNLLVGTTTQATGALLTVNGSIKGTITSGTSVASTSGTAIDFTSIPSWVKRITVMLSALSTNGSSIPMIQIGSGSIVNTGYESQAWTANTSNTSNTSGFIISAINGATYVYDGIATLVLVNSSTNLWVISVCGAGPNIGGFIAGGNKAISGALDRIRITTVNGTDTFDAGSINILYEG